MSLSFARSHKQAGRPTADGRNVLGCQRADGRKGVKFIRPASPRLLSYIREARETFKIQRTQGRVGACEIFKTIDVHIRSRSFMLFGYLSMAWSRPSSAPATPRTAPRRSPARGRRSGASAAEIPSRNVRSIPTTTPTIPTIPRPLKESKHNTLVTTAERRHVISRNDMAQRASN